MPSRTEDQQQKYNHAKRVRTYDAAVNNVKELLLHDTILKDISIDALTNEQIASTMALLKKVAIINKQKLKLDENKPVPKPPALPPKKKRTPVIRSPKQEDAHGKLIMPSAVRESTDSYLKKKYLMLMQKYNESLEHMAIIPADDHKRIENIKESMSKALERLAKIERECGSAD